MVDIAQLIATPKISDPIGDLRKIRQQEQMMGLRALQMQQAQQKLDLAQQLAPMEVEQQRLALDTKRQEVERQNQTRALLGQAFQGNQDAITQLASINPDAYSKVMKVQNDIRDRAKVIGKENTNKVRGIAATILSSPAEERGAVYDAAREELETLTGDVFPETYDSAVLPSFQLIVNATRDIEDIIEKPIRAVEVEEISIPGLEGLPPAAREKAEEEFGKQRAEKVAAYQSAKSKLPGLQDTVAKLSDLADVATYTLTGKIADQVVKQLGFGSTEGATARSQFTAIVDNQILPLLRDTFGAAFTQKEGESLKATLGDVDATPEEKLVVLNSFIDQKVKSLQDMERELGVTTQRGAKLDVLDSAKVKEFNISNTDALKALRNYPNDPKVRAKFKQVTGIEAAEVLN